MLTDEEKQFVIAQFEAYLSPVGNVRATAVAALPVRLQGGVGDGAIPKVLAGWVIDAALADRWNQSPPVLVAVLASFEQLNPKIAEIRARVERTPPPIGQEPLEATLLDTGYPFIDRTRLRRKVREFAPPPQGNGRAQILVVNGKPKSGRSYTKQLFMHYCRPPRITLCCVTKSSWTEPQDLAKDLVHTVGGDVRNLPPPDTNMERWLGDLAKWVMHEAFEARQKVPSDYWFLLDGFGGNDLSQRLRDFITKLADWITTGIYATSEFRLILLEFERASLTVPIGKIVTDETVPIDDLETARGINAILVAKGQILAAQDPTVAQWVLQELPTADGRLLLLNQRLQELLDELAAVEDEPAPVAAAELVGRLCKRRAEAEVKAILTASGKVPVGDYAVFTDRVLQDLPTGQERLPELSRRLRELQEVLQ